MWTHVLIPILPENLKSYIDAPVPFIIGISSENKNGEDNDSLKPSDVETLETRLILFSLEHPGLLGHLRSDLHWESASLARETPSAASQKAYNLKALFFIARFERLAPYENFHKSKSKEILENIDSAFDIALIDNENDD